MEQKRGVPTNSLSHSLASSPQIRDVCTAAVQHDTNNSKLLLSPAVFTTATIVTMSTTTSTATVAVTAATILVATAVALERRRRDRKAAAFMGSASLYLAGEARGARGGRVCSVLDAGDIPDLCM
jgi:hypothetical protein